MRRVEAIELEVEKGFATYDFHTLGLPFGGHRKGRDWHGKFFSKDTEFGIKVGAELPTVHFHGRKAVRGTPFEPKPEFLGISEFMGLSKKGGWFMTRLDQTSKLATRLYHAGRRGALRASTGLAGTLQRWNEKGMYTLWVPGEMTMIEKTRNIGPVNELAVSVPILKALYIDNGLEWLEMVDEQPLTIEPETFKYSLAKPRYRLP